MAEGGRRHLVLQRTEHGQRLFRQEVGTRAEELPQFNQQHAQLDGGDAKGDEHLDQHVNVRLNLVIAALAGANYAASLAVNDPDGPEEKARYSEKSHHLRKSIDAWCCFLHVMR